MLLFSIKMPYKDCVGRNQVKLMLEKLYIDDWLTPTILTSLVINTLLIAFYDVYIF